MGALQLGIQIQAPWDADFHETSHKDALLSQLRLRVRNGLFTWQSLCAESGLCLPFACPSQ